MKNTLYKFYADWCQPCKLLSATLSGMQVANDFDYKEINIEEHNDLVSTYNIKSVPTLLVVDPDNVVLGTISGNKSEQELKQFLDPLK